MRLQVEEQVGWPRKESPYDLGALRLGVIALGWVSFKCGSSCLINAFHVDCQELRRESTGREAKIPRNSKDPQRVPFCPAS